jgi:hypothetical protein
MQNISYIVVRSSYYERVRLTLNVEAAIALTVTVMVVLYKPHIEKLNILLRLATKPEVTREQQARQSLPSASRRDGGCETGS